MAVFQKSMRAAEPAPALCPITGLPAKRLVQRVSARLLSGLWRRPLGVAADRSLGGTARFGLWESTCGLAFFDPMVEGDKSFFQDLYAPPHHLNWWNESALRGLADCLELEVEAIEAVPFSSYDSIMYWMAWLAPKLAGERYFRAHWTWYGALAWSAPAGRMADALLRVPRNAAPSGLLLTARKPTSG